MAGKRDIIWVADTINAQLKISLGAKLNSLDTEYGDGIELEDVPFGNYHVAEQVKPGQWPIISTIPDYTDQHGDGDNFDRYNIEDHYLTIAVAHSVNESEDQLKRRIGRYVRAVEEVMLENPTLGASVTDVSVLTKPMGPMQHEENSLLQEGQVLVRVMTNT